MKWLFLLLSVIAYAIWSAVLIKWFKKKEAEYGNNKTKGAHTD
jgi:hypothetical protein